MSKSILNAKAFQSEKAAYEWLENRIWPEGPVCPHCGGFERIGKMKGEATRFGLYKCYQCRKQFRATVGTVFEKSHVPMTLWLQAMYLLASSKKGISANQLHRTFGVSLKTAWFIAHRLRLAMTAVGLQAPMGGEGKIVEADEAYMGELEEPPPPSPQRRGKPFLKSGRGGGRTKRTIIGLVERGGEVRMFHVGRATKETVGKIIRENVAKRAGCKPTKAFSIARSARNTPLTKPLSTAARNTLAAT